MVSIPTTQTVYVRNQGDADDAYTEVTLTLNGGGTAYEGTFDGTDGNTLEVAHQFLKTKTVVNDVLPVAAGTISDVVAGYGTSINVNAAAAFSGTNLVYSATGLPSWASINPSTGAITGTAPSVDGLDTVTVYASNSAGTSAGVAFSLTVQEYEFAIRTVSQSNRVFSARDLNSTRDSVAFRTPYIITDTHNLRFAINNWVMSAGGSIDGEPFTVLDMSVDIGGTVVPLTFSASRSRLIAAGEDVFADVLKPVDFGLSTFDMGTTVWLKGRIQLAAVNTYIVENHHRSTGEQTGTQLGWYLSTDTTVSSTDVSGAYTVVSGPALYGRSYLFAPLLLGNPVVDYSVGLVGDSIGAGLTDGNFGAAGGGFFQRAAYGDGSTDVIPVINACVGGRNSDDYIGDINMQSIYQYCRHWGYQHAANDINATTTLIQQQTRFTDLISDLSSGGAEKTFCIPPFARTTSTDNFATVANQTYLNVGWEPSGVADLFEAWQYTQVGVTTDALWPTTSIRDATFTRKWEADGTAQKWTADGLHCKEQSNIDLAADHYAPMRSL